MKIFTGGPDSEIFKSESTSQQVEKRDNIKTEVTAEKQWRIKYKGDYKSPWANWYVLNKSDSI